MRDDIKAALEVGYQYIQIDGDNLIVIQAGQGVIHIPWRIQPVI